MEIFDALTFQKTICYTKDMVPIVENESASLVPSTHRLPTNLPEFITLAGLATF
jgi:hypothetical protein